MVSNMDILVEILTAMRAYQHMDDPDSKGYEDAEAQGDLDALILLAKGESEEVMKKIGDDKLFMLSVRLTNKIYGMIKADRDV